jgi:phage terminase large subunit-like protein
VLDRVLELLPTLDEPSAQLLLRQLQEARSTVRAAAWSPYPWQKPPRALGTHDFWLMLGGRGIGKTEGCARYFNDHMRGPACDPRARGGHRSIIIGPTIGDVIESAYSGPSGLSSIDPSLKLSTSGGGTHVKWPNGSTARVLGAYTREDQERLRSAGNTCLVWMEELAAMRHLGPAIDHLTFGLRIGPHPHWIGSTTPKPRAELRELIKGAQTLVTHGRTADAHGLNEEVRKLYFRKYHGTRLGKQELEGLVLDDVEGALWREDILGYCRVTPGDVPAMQRVIVSVDPPGQHRPGSAECGLIVLGIASGVVYVLADLSGRMSPEQWAAQALWAYSHYQANAIVAEVNYGGAMVASTIQLVARSSLAIDIDAVPIRQVNSRRGKYLRAEPVAAVYEQAYNLKQPARVRHVGRLELLEDQMSTWVPTEPGPSPDRVDALVHGVTDLLVLGGTIAVASPTSLPRRLG